MQSPFEQWFFSQGNLWLNMLYPLLNDYGFILSLIAGALLPSLYLDRGKTGKASPLYRTIVIAFLLTFTFGTLVSFTLPLIILGWTLLQGVANQPITFYLNVYWQSLIFIIGFVSHIYLRRIISPKLNELEMKLTKKTKLARNERTDVRTVRALLPETESYDPMDHINLKKGIFIGLNEKKQPQYIPIKDWQSQHADIIGTTGAGKGVASAILLAQSIMAGEGVFVGDPKNDEWAPHLFRQVCEDTDKPFYLIDLNNPEYQLNLLADITADQLEELLVAGFSLAEKGDIADFYRIGDRRAARMCAQEVNKPILDEHEKEKDIYNTLRKLFNSDYVQGLNEDVPAFFGKMEELALVNAINASNGLSLKKIFDEGGCCYIIGSMRNGKIIAAQRMLLVRLLQIAETRDRINTQPRPIAIFLDELKYHLSRPAMEGLGAARDKGVHIIMAHQSIADLKDCPADLNGESVVGAVVENTKFKLVYKLQDPETAEWVARMSGTILVDDETRKVEANQVLIEEVSDDRTIRQAERHFIDSNMLLNLPPFVCFVFTKDLAKPSLISPIKTTKRIIEHYHVPPQACDAVIADPIRTIGSNSEGEETFNQIPSQENEDFSPVQDHQEVIDDPL
ncbi:type IV secretory system conjugative DNA transfer family protein [Shewanella colwelliana]|uniref:type IV secretory system conjugative DNA transfer family protein n=1 Tax=Shewanella colwelliana TaxID=23 RepID=UPI00373528F4